MRNPPTPHAKCAIVVVVFVAAGEQGSAGDALLPAAVQGAPQHVSEVARPKAAAAAAGQVRKKEGGGGADVTVGCGAYRRQQFHRTAVAPCRLSSCQFFFFACRPAHFLWMEFAAQALTFKVGALEPVFCSLALYRIVSRIGKKGAEVDLSRSGRVSETFW